MQNRPKFEFQVSNCTPWMMKDASGEALAPLNGKALRGLMRFWFRALYYGASKPVKIEGDLAVLRELEYQLFGSTKNRGILDIVVKELTPQSSQQVWPGYVPLEANGRAGKNALYTGYHPSHSDKLQITKKLNTKFSWKVFLSFNVSLLSENALKFQLTNEQWVEFALNSFKALIWFGGCGGRSRRGFGALQIDKVSDDLASEFEHLKMTSTKVFDQAQLLLNLGKAYPRLPAITATSSGFRLGATSKRDSFELMRHVDHVYKKFRYRKSGFRKDGYFPPVANRISAPANAFSQLSKSSSAIEAQKNYLVKAALGLPIVSPNIPGNGKLPAVPPWNIKPVGYDRRASPLFFKPLMCLSKERQPICLGLFLYLPALFVPTQKLVFEYSKESREFQLHQDTVDHYIRALLSGLGTIVLPSNQGK